MKLPKIGMNPPPERWRSRLARWLSEWEAERILRDEEPAEFRTEPGATLPTELASGTETEPPPETGQVRLLSPELKAGYERPLYLAVLTRTGSDRFVVAPYGRFAEPATDGELLTNRDTPALRVLCLWNTVETTRSILARSWYIETLPGNDLTDALTVRDAISGKTDMPEHLAQRTGPPLVHPADPRHDYVEEERERTMPLIAELVTDNSTSHYNLTRPEDLPLAAEPKEPYETNSTPEHGE